MEIRHGWLTSSVDANNDCEQTKGEVPTPGIGGYRRQLLSLFLPQQLPLTPVTGMKGCHTALRARLLVT